MSLINFIDGIVTRSVSVREKTNRFLAPLRRRQLRGKDKPAFTIISNNCWAGHVYRYFGLPYDTPTIGLYLYTADYLKFLKDLERYIKEVEPVFIRPDESKWADDLKEKGIDCPIGRLDDIEVLFLHYKSEDEARQKWERRKKRIHWDKLFIKMSEQNLCTEDDIREFDSLPYKNKIIFTHKDYQIPSQVIFKEFEASGEVLNDTIHFNRYVDLAKWINSGL